jgi:hypothetical protein
LGKKPPAPFAKVHAWTSELVCPTWTRKNYMPLLGIKTQFFGHPTICLIMHGALLAPFVVQYGLHIFDVKFCNFIAAQAYAAVNGHNKICCTFVSAGQ